ncbi:hypothetical protein DdX_02475 [Ditylenchus destructor]|uniref:DUF7515 domain-containing protein n=1 Tax=Ditylenchus destructor TaxID=166010 RepID=A0AAD4NCT4_9BILA|nr:hypothetical protein DdX_02475 [Ditylenchus destructor]
MPFVISYDQYMPPPIKLSGEVVEHKDEENVQVHPDNCEHCHPTANEMYREENGFVGGKDYDYRKFCEELYKVLYSSKEGYTKTSQLLFDLREKSGIDGTKVAHENGYGIFGLLMKDKQMFGHVVAYERNPPGTKNFSFRYTATLSAEFDYLRRIVPQKKSYFHKF